MTKAELIACFAMENQLANRASERIIKSIFEELEESLQRGGRIEFRGFGSFFVKEYGAYEARNPQNGEKKRVNARKKVRFRPSDLLLERLNKEFYGK